MGSSGSMIGLCLSAMAAGVVNSLAGGGTLLTFPMLVLALTAKGLSRDEATVVANATSTVALVPGSLAGAWGYRREMPAAQRWLLILTGPSLVGGIVGSLLVTRLPAKYFAELVPWLLLLAAVVFLADTLLGRFRKPNLHEAGPSVAGVAGLVLCQFLVAVYGGYFGAGAGILMLTSLALMGVGDMHRMNALKTILNGCLNAVAVLVFINDGKVNWTFAIPMAVAAVLGGYVGAWGALRVKPQYVRWGVICIGFALAGYYFWRQ